MEGIKNKSDLEKQSRIENFERQRVNLLNQGYKEYIKTYSIIKINLLVFASAGPFAVLMLLIYLFSGGILDFHSKLSNNFILIAAFIISIPVHEFLHGLTWHFFCKNKWKSIRYGVMMDSLTPYCHCKEPLKYDGYILGGLMPFLILGIGISILGIIFHEVILIYIGVLNILTAGGDTTIAFVSLKYRDCVIMDHPTECGFIAFRK